MKRIVLTTLAVVATAAGLFWPVVPSLVSSDPEPASDPVSMTRYDAAYAVDADGTLTAEETVTAEFPYGRHGIFRYWDVADADDSSVRYFPEDVRVTLDDAEVPSTMLWEEGRRYRVLKVGDPDAYVAPGTHRYRIRYRIDGALAPDGDRAAFRWDVVPRGWEMAIATSTTTVDLPAAASGVTCTVVDGSPCTVTGDGTGRVTVTTGALPPRTGVHLDTTLEVAAPARTTLPWPVALDATFGGSVPLLAGILALSALGLLAGLRWSSRSHERPPGFPVMYEPPAALGPVQTVYVADEDVPSRATVATLTYLAEQGLVRLDRDDDRSWTVEGIAAQERWTATDPVSRALGESLGVTTVGGRFSADRSVDAGRTLSQATSTVASATRSWARSEGVVRSAFSERLGKNLVVLALVAAGLCFTWFASDVPTVVGLPFAAFVIGGCGLLSTGAGTRRTPAGRDLWSRSGGFRRLLSTPSSQDRLDFSARSELYTSFIPYAIAFGCADAWADKYRAATGTEPPTPSWMPVPAHSGGHAFSSGGDAFAGFESSLASSISAYQATQSSSSSSSGGGGGGGGGGGSW